jgi:hypothetical protein
MGEDELFPARNLGCHSKGVPMPGTRDALPCPRRAFALLRPRDALALLRRCRALGLLGLLCLFGQPAAGHDRAPVPTRWMAPPGVERMPHEPWQATGPFAVVDLPCAPAEGGREQGRVAIVVEFALEPVVGPALEQYAADLAIKGYTAILSAVSGGTPADLRAYLIQLYNEPAGLAGAIFVGDVPYAIYELVQYWDGGPGPGREYEDFPCDIYFMDMTGSWYDDGAGGTVPAGNGKYDRWVDTQHGIEIWVGRMKVDTLAQLGSPPAILNNYFGRNHLYRTGRLVPEDPPARALVYVDDDWGSMVQGTGGDEWCLEQIYSDVTSVFDIGGNPGNNATALNYRTEHLPQDYQMIFVRSHGSPAAHGFYENSGANFNYVYSTHYMSIDPPAQFYSMFICSGCDYTAQYGQSSSYLGGVAAFNEHAGLAAWGSTKTGGMWNDQDFYTVLGHGACLGDSFVQWFNVCHAVWPEYAPQWWYGMVIIGDAAIVPNGDYFAPAAPSGLTAVAEAEDVALSWQPNLEPDLDRYNIYRADGAQPRIWVADVDAPGTAYWDSEVLGGHTYTYWLTAVDALDNESDLSEPDSVTYGVFSGLDRFVAAPAILFPCEPNPFGAETIFTLTLPQSGRVALSVYDAAGRRVRSLVDATLSPGTRMVGWDGCDDAGAPLGAGVYFGRLDIPGGRTISRSVLLVR